MRFDHTDHHHHHDGHIYCYFLANHDPDHVFYDYTNHYNHYNTDNHSDNLNDNN